MFHYAKLNHGLYMATCSILHTHNMLQTISCTTQCSRRFHYLIPVTRSLCVRSVRPGAADALEPSSLLCVESPVRAPERSELPSGEHARFAPELASQSSTQLRLVHTTSEYRRQAVDNTDYCPWSVTRNATTAHPAAHHAATRVSAAPLRRQSSRARSARDTLPSLPHVPPEGRSVPCTTEDRRGR